MRLQSQYAPRIFGERLPRRLSSGAATWASCGSSNGNVSAGQKSFCEALIPQRYQPPSEPANKLVSGQTNYCLLHRHPLPNNRESRSKVLAKVTSVCAVFTLAASFFILALALPHETEHIKKEKKKPHLSLQHHQSP